MFFSSVFAVTLGSASHLPSLNDQEWLLPWSGAALQGSCSSQGLHLMSARHFFSYTLAFDLTVLSLHLKIVSMWAFVFVSVIDQSSLYTFNPSGSSSDVNEHNSSERDTAPTFSVFCLRVVVVYTVPKPRKH